MLRYSFLPSDYHPMVLMLGEAQDMRVLSGVLRRFSRAPQRVEFSSVEAFAPSDTQITLTPAAAEPLGMYPLSLKDKRLRWSLDAAAAELFADMVDELAVPGRRSGAERLACGDYREIPVKVSRGEFPDDYLMFHPRETKA